MCKGEKEDERGTECHNETTGICEGGTRETADDGLGGEF
jgi:hypothetical protein